MPRVRRALIERRVLELLDQSGLLQPPVDVYAVAERLGLDVRTRPLDKELSGFMQRTDGGAVIAVNADHTPNRQRFTLAHELGHWSLDHGDAVIDSHLYRDQLASAGENVVEIEANTFAASLLMPAEWLRDDVPASRVLGPLDEDVTDDLARLYQVSQQAMAFRLMNLGLMKS